MRPSAALATIASAIAPSSSMSCARQRRRAACNRCGNVYSVPDIFPGKPSGRDDMRTARNAGLFSVLALFFSLSAYGDGDFAADVHALKQFRDGRDVFRYATFGDEDFWGDTLGLHEAVAHVSPKTALSV